MKWLEKKEISGETGGKIPWISRNYADISFDLPQKTRKLLGGKSGLSLHSPGTKIYEIKPADNENQSSAVKSSSHTFYFGFPGVFENHSADREYFPKEESILEEEYSPENEARQSREPYWESPSADRITEIQEDTEEWEEKNPVDEDIRMDNDPFPEDTESPENTIIESREIPLLTRESILELEKDLSPDPEEFLPQKKMVSFPGDSSDMASITPVIHVNRQYEIPFQILKIQKQNRFMRDHKETEKIIQKLEDSLSQFSIVGKVVGIQDGPIITRYEIKLEPGIKVSRVLSLTDDIAMAMEAISVRIEAPIPGRATVGIEIPHKNRMPVTLGDLLNEKSFYENEMNLPVPLGKDIAGNPVSFDLSKMPHLLIAGATGSGKSVTVNSIITNFILSMGPDYIRFLMIDPKLVELSHYNDIPHLLHPVITEHQKAILSLNWAVEEMERRYEDLLELKVRDIRAFNEKIKNTHRKIPPMPYIIILIDELGDLMMVAGKEVQDSIVRLSQKARAVGIHLILATQRPSVDVITGIIKANFPARIALQVAQKTDSRTILDSNGAEALLGQGDLLFKHPAKSQLIRAQAPLVEDAEVENVVKKAMTYGKPVYIRLDDPKANSGELNAEEEELLEKSWEFIRESQKASASSLQRRFRIGYNRAARIIEALEARGFIGAQIGSRPREIFSN